jgi:putative flippase GtrA
MNTSAKQPHIQIILFVLVGGLSALIHFLTVILLVEALRFPPLFVNIFGYLAAVLFSYYGHSRLTFNVRVTSHKTFLKFLITSFIMFLINQTLFYVTLRILNIQYHLALFITILTVALLTFIAFKFKVFKNA